MDATTARSILFRRVIQFLEGICQAYSKCSDVAVETRFNGDRINNIKISYKNLNGNPRTVLLYLMPCISGFVGPDLLAGTANGFKAAFVEEETGNQLEPYRRDYFPIDKIEDPAAYQEFFNHILKEMLGRGIL